MSRPDYYILEVYLMNLSRATKVYMGIIYFLATLLAFWLAFEYDSPGIFTLIFWALLSAATESLAILLPNGVAVSVGFAINLAAIIVGGPFAAAVISTMGFLFRVLKVKDGSYAHILNTPIFKTAFNVSQTILVTGISGVVYIAGGGQIGKFSLVPTLLILPVYIILSSVIMTMLVSFIKKQRFEELWLDNVKGIIPSSMAIGMVGVIIALAYIGYGAGAVLLFFGPLLLARFSFKLYIDMRNIYIETIQALNKSMEAKDSYTSGHAARVQEYAVNLARRVDLPEKKIQNIRTAAILHDIGKIGIDDNILKKPQKLTAIEYKTIQKHPVIGAEILKDVVFLKEISDIIRHHHERYDGKGYPDGLKGEAIPVEASILAIADVYDAMTSDRPYRNSLGHMAALNELRSGAGSQFNPLLVDKFLKLDNIQKE